VERARNRRAAALKRWQKQIRTLRADLDESVDQFAERFGCSPRAVEDWEQGRRVPHAFIRRAMERLATTLKGKKPRKH